jgi:drug/metabolite transporter (DMT)-like permease
MRPAEKRPSVAQVNALVGLLCLIWGSTWIVIKTGLEDLPPITSVGARFSVAAVVMAGVAVLLRGKEGGHKPAAFLWVTLGTVNFAASYTIVYLAETALPSGLVSVLWGTFPMIMAACGHWFLPGERLRVPQWAGFVLGFCGVVVLFRTDVRSFGAEAVPMALLLLLSPLISAGGTTVIKRWGQEASSVLLNRNALFLGAGLTVLAGMIAENGEEVRWTGQALFSVGYLAVAGTVVTFGLYFWLLRYASAHKLSLIAYVTPVIALTLGWFVGNEPVTTFTLAGSGLILLGVVLAVRK